MEWSSKHLSCDLAHLFIDTKNGYQTAHLNLEREKCIKSLVGSPGNMRLCMGKEKLLERKNYEHL